MEVDTEPSKIEGRRNRKFEMKEKQKAIPLPSSADLEEFQVYDDLGGGFLSEAAVKGINTYKRTRLLEDFENLSLKERDYNVASEGTV